jgi:hypothetical protein
MTFTVRTPCILRLDTLVVQRIVATNEGGVRPTQNILKDE